MDRSAPVYFVAVRKAGEKGEPLNLSSKVLSLRFTDEERKADKLSLSVDNFDLANFDDPVWAHGNILQFTFGYASHLSPMRECVIRKVTGARQLTIEAHGMSVVMDRVKRRESFENMTRAEVVEIIAARNGYSGETLAVESTDERFEVITQNNLTDAQMLRKLAHLEGKEFFVDYDGLHWHTRDLEQAPIRELVYYSDPDQGDILDFNIENDITRKPGRVRVKSRNPETGETITGLADNETDTDRAVLQETKATEELLFLDAESGATETGSRQIPTDQPVAYEQDIASNVQTEEEAKTEAKRRYRKATQRAVKMTMTIVGDPTIVAKSVIKVSGMGNRLSGKYYVQSVSSEVSGGGEFTQQLKLITDGYQRRFGTGKGQGQKMEAGLGALSSALRFVVEAVQPVSDSQIVSGVERIIAKGVALGKSGGTDRAGLAGLARSAGRVAGLLKQLVRKGQAEQPAEYEGLYNALQNLARIAKALANIEDAEAKGKLNTADVADARAKVPRQTLDRETGTFKTVFVDARSRGKK